MRLLFPVSLLIFTLICQSSTHAADQFKTDIEAARKVYLKAIDGTERDLRQAIKKIRQLESKYPGNPLVLAYKGGALSLRGKDIGKRPLDRMRETEEGLNIIDRALRTLAQYEGHYLDSVGTRLVAAYVFINLPDAIFHRLKEGDHLVQQLLAHSQFSEMPYELQAAIYFAAATAAEKSGDEKKFKHYLELTFKTDPDGKNGKKAETLLKQLAG